jgi:hypothetical protein
MTKRFTAIIIIANLIMSLLMYLSSQQMLFELNRRNPYVTATGVNFWSIYIGAVQVGSSPIPLVITSSPNLPSYVLIFTLIVNALFIIRLQRTKEA